MISDQDYELLSAYLDDALPADMRADLEARLPREAALRRELDILRATVDLIHGLPDLKAPRNFTLDASMVRRPAQRWLIFPTTAAFSALSAAAAFVLVALAVALSSFNASAPSTSPQIAFGNTLAVEEQESPTEITQAAQPAAPFEATEEQATLSTTDGFTATEPLLYAAPLGTLTPDVTLLAAPPDAEGDAAGAGMSVMSAAAVTEEAVTANA
ncbi:MAG: hypothetical protein JNJ61_22240, partial [Anaerolineae bacterium]|nr:hypothetical protein [Anaerolineae bacterium]